MWRVLHFVLSMAAVSVLGVLLITQAPGVGIDERELSGQPSAATLERIKQERAGDASFLRLYAKWAGGLLRGDLGHSEALNRPVTELLRERIPVTARVAVPGLLVAWLGGLALALAAVAGPAWLRWLPVPLSGALACIPAAVAAFAVAWSGGPAFLAIGFAVLPKIFSYTEALMRREFARPARLMALARGLSPGRVLLHYVLRPAGPELLALAGASVPLAIGAAIPVEVFSDTAGIGQLAWKAASARDVFPLVNLTLLITGITLLVSGGGERRHA